MLYLIKANQLADVDPAGIKVPTLLISSPTDLVFPPARIDRTATAIASNGTYVERASLTGPNGHLNGVLHIQQAGPVMADFLARPLPLKK
jgi:homoserine O-acetyltransferase